MSETLTLKEEIVLTQLRQNYQRTVEVFESLDQKAGVVVSVSSIVATIMTGFQLTSPQAADAVGLAFILLLYILTMFASFMAMLPKDFTYEPIHANWDAIRDALNKSDSDLYYGLLSGYEDSIRANRAAIDRKSDMVRLAFLLLAVNVSVALLIVFVP